MKKPVKIKVQGVDVSIQRVGVEDYISLTDMAKKFGDDNLIYQWMRNRNTVEILGIWEQINNPDFKGIEFDTFRAQAGLNSFTLTPRKWVEATNAIGIRSTAGRGGGTFAHQDLAFEFGTWLSPAFKLYLIKEYQRLKADESRRLSLDWNLHRTLSKLNYRIHTDAIKEHIIPNVLTAEQIAFTYASEADILNVALFGHTAKQWRDRNGGLDGNIRDYATIEQLLVLTNLEGMNAEFIRMGLSPADRLRRLNEIAISQLKTLAENPSMKALNSTSEDA